MKIIRHRLYKEDPLNYLLLIQVSLCQFLFLYDISFYKDIVGFITEQVLLHDMKLA